MVGCVIKQNEASHLVSAVTDFGILGTTGASCPRVRPIAVDDYIVLHDHVTTSPFLHDMGEAHPARATRSTSPATGL